MFHEIKLSRWCDGLLEAGWLAAVVTIPLFFNIHSDRVFEPDKLTLLRSIALVMVAAWLVKFIDQRGWQNLDWIKPKSESSIWRMPFVPFVFLLVIVYLISTLFSVSPTVSLLGSYQRLQGTYTTLSYIVIFTLMATTMRSWAQVQRVVTAVIIASIPVSFYALLQHFELDPLPWGGNTQVRVAGHMGNSIFVAAYLIMVLPLTAARIIESFTNILNDEELSYADVIRSSIYIFTLAIQVLAIVWTRSRGPFVGLGVGMFAFGLIVLVSLRNATDDKRRFRVTDLLWTLLLMTPAVFGLVASSLVGGLSLMNSSLIFVAGLALVVVVIFVLVAMRRGWHWLWLSWILLAVFAAGWFVLFNLPGELTDPYAEAPIIGDVFQTMDEWRELPEIGRLGSVLEDDARTGRVRVLIWQGALDLIKPHEPLQYPDGSSDIFNFLRPLIGYGPESMYVAYNRFYPPELATIESRNASPDRSHNETFDALVITGGLGFLAWQLLYISVFYYGFRWLGVVRSKFDRNLLIILWIVSGLLMTLLFVAWRGQEYIGVALPFGSIGGLILYLIYYAVFGRGDDEQIDPFKPERLLMTALVAAVAAHYIEIHFGIAIAATRLHFFVYVALMFVVGYTLPCLKEKTPEVVEAKGRRRRKGRRSSEPVREGVWGPVLLYTLVLILILGTLGFEFMTYSLPPGRATENLAQELTAGEILYQSLFLNARKEFSDSPFIFMMIIMTWMLGVLLSLSEMVKSGELSFTAVSSYLRANRQQIVTIVYALLSLIGLGGIVYFYFVAPPATITGTLGRTLLLIWTALIVYAAILLLLKRDSSRFIAALVAMIGLSLSLPVLVAAGFWYGLGTAVLALFLLYLLWDNNWNDSLFPAGMLAFLSLAGGLAFTFLQASMVKSSIVPQVTQEFTSTEALRVFEASLATNFLTLFYVFVISVLIVAAFVVAGNSRTQNGGHAVAYISLIVLFTFALAGLAITNVRVIQSDIVFKRGKGLEPPARIQRDPERREEVTTAWDSTIAVYEHALDLAPREDFYYLFLGRAYLERSTLEADPAKQVELFKDAEKRLLRRKILIPSTPITLLIWLA